MKIVHIDMDAFYASVEELDNPHLKGKPVIVGGPSNQRGVVSAANYIARKFGVHSAMPMATANRLCPDGIVITPRHSRYVDISKQIQAIFVRYTPIIQPLSLDEAFLDLNDSVKLFGSVIDIARCIKTQIHDELNLTASVGVAPNKFLAKLASDADKPNGFVVVENDQIEAFLEPLPISRLWGVGQSTARRLEQQAIYNVADLKKLNRSRLIKSFGDLQGHHLWNLARGIDDRKVVTESRAKSISRETTFSNDVNDLKELRRVFVSLSEDVCQRLRNQSLNAKTIQIKYRRKDFKTFTRSASLPMMSNNTAMIWNTVNQLFESNINTSVLPLRLIGVGLSNLTNEENVQSDLFHTESDQIDSLADQINKKFGKASISRAQGIAKAPPQKKSK